MKRFSSNFNSVHLVPASIELFGQISNFFPKSKMAAAAILNSKNIINFRMDKAISPNFNSVHLVPASIDPMGQIYAILTKF